MLVDELHKQIYIKSTTSIIKSFQRQGSLRQSQRNDNISYLKLALKQATQQAEAEAGNLGPVCTKILSPKMNLSI